MAWGPGVSAPVCSAGPQGVHGPPSRAHCGESAPAVHTGIAALGAVSAALGAAAGGSAGRARVSAALAAAAGGAGIDATGGIGSTLPAVSTARTESWCGPVID